MSRIKYKQKPQVCSEEEWSVMLLDLRLESQEIHDNHFLTPRFRFSVSTSPSCRVPVRREGVQSLILRRGLGEGDFFLPCWARGAPPSLLQARCSPGS